MSKIKIGVVGAGIYGNYHIHTYTCDKNVEKVVFCDLNEERKKATAEKYNVTGYSTVKEMIKNEELDAISIATPDPYHFEPLKDAIEAGIKNILVEKPLATPFTVYFSYSPITNSMLVSSASIPSSLSLSF